MAESKYKTQIKNLRKNYVRLGLDFKPDVLNEFKRLCAENGSTATTEIKRFVAEYCQRYREPQE